MTALELALALLKTLPPPPAAPPRPGRPSDVEGQRVALACALALASLGSSLATRREGDRLVGPLPDLVREIRGRQQVETACRRASQIARGTTTE